MELLRLILEFVCGELAKQAFKCLRSSGWALFDSRPLPPIFSLDRRRQAGFITYRKQPDPNRGKWRATDAVGVMPRFQFI